MYYKYFGLEQAPFRITPDTSLFFPGGNRGAVLEALIYAITNGEGIVKVVGEVGSGKTMICRMLTIELPEHIEVVYLANPSLSPDNILHAIAFELKLDVNPDDDRLGVMNKLQNYLLERHANGHQVVVFVEEAQGMPLATLEQIRLLSNLETNEYKLLQIVLFGQPELDQMIARREIRQLKERITYSFNLAPLNSEEIKDYVNTRLRACGFRSGEIFTSQAVRLIRNYSLGLIRRINILCDKAMLASYAANDRKVRARHVRIAARDTEFISPWYRYRVPVYIVGMMALVTVLVLFTPVRQSLTGFFKGLSAPVTAIRGQDAEPSVPVQDGETSEEPLHLQLIQSTAGQPEAGSDAPEAGGQTVRENTEETEAQQEGSPDEFQEISMTDLLDYNHYTAGLLSESEDMEVHEQEAFIEQVKQLPPESVYLVKDRIQCRHCALIVYRPVRSNENL